MLQNCWSKCEYSTWYYGPNPFELSIPVMAIA